eukprot:366310-Chlamydomonas_euryale.AAC.1
MKKGTCGNGYLQALCNDNRIDVEKRGTLSTQFSITNQRLASLVRLLYLAVHYQSKDTTRHQSAQVAQQRIQTHQTEALDSPSL